MCFLLKIFFVGTITFLSNTTYSFIKFYLLLNDKGNTILILGDYHYEASLTQKNKEHIDLFIGKVLESNNSTIPCIIELDKTFEPAFIKGETLPTGMEMASTMVHLSRYLSEGSVHEKVKFITYDPRKLDSFLLIEMLRWLAQLLPNARSNKPLLSGT